ncbi:MAG: hypothetical protein J0L75_09015 [Spirochaetes bacterium]|nr:hypothetical protein [Spirochaetota bacterium]
MKTPLATFAAIAVLLLGACTSPVAPPATAPTVTNAISYYYTIQPQVRAQSPLYWASVALMNSSSNVLYDFSVLSASTSPSSAVPPGTYLLAWRAWTNTAAGLVSNAWNVSNTVTLRSFYAYTLRIDSSATNQVHFAEQPGNTVITVLEY